MSSRTTDVLLSTRRLPEATKAALPSDNLLCDEIDATANDLGEQSSSRMFKFRKILLHLALWSRWFPHSQYPRRHPLPPPSRWWLPPR